MLTVCGLNFTISGCRFLQFIKFQTSRGQARTKIQLPEAAWKDDTFCICYRLSVEIRNVLSTRLPTATIEQVLVGSFFASLAARQG